MGNRLSMLMADIPKIFIIADPNGTGKTTFARELLPGEAGCLQFVNADQIAAGLSPVAPKAAALQAGRLMLTQITHHVAHGRFALETTLSGLGYARQIAMAGAGLCGLSAFFGAAECRNRPSTCGAARQTAGQDIPEAVIRRRFAAGQATLARCCASVDDWDLYDNSGPSPVLILERTSS